MAVKVIKIAHVITGLSYGGAEMMLCKLLSRWHREEFQSQVISLADMGLLGGKIESLGVPVRALGMRREVPDPAGLLRLARWLKRDQPHLVQTWMYHADLVGGLAARLAGAIPVVWNIRHSNIDPRGMKRLTRWTVRACARTARWLPDRIVCCSEASQRSHVALGYAPEKMVMIPNGFDLDAFRPDAEARRSLRLELGIPTGAVAIGLVGRYDEKKDHRTFFEAAARLVDHTRDVRFVLCGEGVTAENPRIARWMAETGVRDCCHLLGRRDDIARISAALDIASSSSAYGEGFPNVVGEAMACGVPCVVTDVGDSSSIVGDTGRVVPPRDPRALAQAWLDLVRAGEGGRAALGVAARKRIEERYSLPQVAARYEDLYRSVVSESACRGGQPLSAGPGSEKLMDAN